MLNTEYSDKLDELYHMGGTSGGTRPKIMTIDQWGRMDHKISCPCRWERIQEKWSMIIPAVPDNVVLL